MPKSFLLSRLIPLAIFMLILIVPILLLLAGLAYGKGDAAAEAPGAAPKASIRAELRSIPVPLPTPRPSPPPRAREPDPVRPAPPLPRQESACRAALKELGIPFADRDPVRGEGGCAIAHPVAIERLARSVALEPETLLNCATALALARFFSEAVPQIAARTLGRPVASVRHASAYVCRPRRGSHTLSEHAFGNALDIAAFTLSDGSIVPVAEHDDAESPAARFLAAFRAAACGPFKTVLGPGADADHADHIHLDMKARRNGYTYCR